ncbi:MAG: UDP-glucose/GDP-mannose dehydrogenase family protein [Alphaproteobacteria bacterium]|nr:UDP-glucose/GDP-mannose dehydrogenase family protein [Alphaproteobacteria bacterium]MCY4231528.1 UDP-glucose/GDP-mannose dehydrogenase family protein [Alphaproteobacteria bacterium]MCY4317917.1 UDP-glucose/GDP-mannose dehydrogenase family protein [Alphaproteobacteria bacterium]
MRIAMVGAGYVGLVTGACFSEFGTHAVCVDRNAARIDMLRRGDMPIYEPGLADLVARNATAGRLTFSTDLAAAVAEADIVFIAVGTPSRRGDGHADLSFVFDAAREVAAAAQGYTVLVTKSTVPVGTGARVAGIVAEQRPDAEIDVVSNPEFLREGAAIEDFIHPDRVVIGVETDRARAAMHELYRPLFLRETPILFTDRETAELTKYAANAFLAVKVTFINEIADLCERVGADVQDVARGMGLDRRIGGKFLHPGPGYGGSCFPKDTLALTRTASDAGSPMRLVEMAAAVNDARKQAMAARVVEALGGDATAKTVAVLGLAFKPNTDDMREAPSLALVPALQAAGATLRVYDPQAMASARPLLSDVTWCCDVYDAAAGAHCAVLVTEWNEFRAVDMNCLRSVMAAPVLLDLRNVYKPAEMAEAGFIYRGIGKGRAA